MGCVGGGLAVMTNWRKMSETGPVKSRIEKNGEKLENLGLKCSVWKLPIKKRVIPWLKL